MAELINMPRAAWRRQPQGKVSVSNKYPYFDFVWKASSTQKAIIGPTITNYLAPKVTANGYAISGGYLIVSGNIPSLHTTQWTEVGCFFLNSDYSDYIATLSCRDEGQAVLLYSNKVSLISWNVIIVDISCTIPLGVCNYYVAYRSGSTHKLFLNGRFVGSDTNSSSPLAYNGTYAAVGAHAGSGLRSGVNSLASDNYLLMVARVPLALPESQCLELSNNPWQLFTPDPPRFYLIPSGGSSPTSQISIDALIQRAGLTQTTSLDALLQSAFSRSLSLDSLIAAVQAETISLDALLQIVGTRTITIDALLQATKSDVISIDALVQMTLAQSLSLDALIVAMGSASSSTNLDALIQSLKTAGISLDALLSKPMTVASVMDALIQAAKTGTVSLDALITGASSTTVFVGLDALIQAIQAKTISLDALLQKSYTSPLALDAYVALTQVKTMSLDALLQSTKSGVISLDAILQMTKTAMVSFDALIQAAKTGVISLDAILVFATQASILLDAYVQKTLARGVGLDAIIGSIADMILPTGRVITVPASDRFVFVTHSDRVI